MRKNAGHTLAVKTITTHLSFPSLIFLTTIIYSEKNMYLLGSHSHPAGLSFLNSISLMILAIPPSNPGALFLTQHRSPWKNATTELPSSFFSHSHKAGRVSQCSGSGSFGDLLVSHQEHTVAFTALWRHVVTCSSPAELLGSDRTAVGESTAKESMVPW